MNDPLHTRKKALARYLDKARTTLLAQRVPRAPEPPLHDLLDKFVEQVDFEGLGLRWHEIEESSARSMLQEMLSHDLAYGTELDPPERVDEQLELFFSLFEHEARWFSNRQFGTHSWSPITTSTFDGGVIGYDGDVIAMLWFEDED